MTSKRGSRGQISLEYLVVVGFVTVLIISTLGAGYFYSSGIRDRIKFNQLSSFSNKVLSSAEAVYYAGEPSKVTLTAYMPPGIQKVEIIDQNLVFTVSTGNGVAKISFTSNVPLLGTLTPTEGVQRIQLIAQPGGVQIVEG